MAGAQLPGGESESPFCPVTYWRADQPHGPVRFRCQIPVCWL